MIKVDEAILISNNYGTETQMYVKGKTEWFHRRPDLIAPWCGACTTTKGS